LEAILTGDPISADRAAQFGLVNRLVEPGEATVEAFRFAHTIASNAPLAVRESLAIAKASIRGEDEAVLWISGAKALGRVAATYDFEEGPRAFLERRAPQSTGT